MRILTALFFVGLSITAFAAERQDLNTLQQAVGVWLEQSLANSPGQSSYRIQPIDSRLQLAPCHDFQIGLPSGYRLAGKTMVRVQCTDGANWSISMPVQISIQVTYFTAARPLAANQELREGDLSPKQGDLAQLPGSVILDATQAVGRTLNSAVAAGNPIRQEMLRAATVIVQNQKVKVQFRDGGIEVANEGIALANALEGQAVRVKVSNGQIITGTAKMGGIVEVGQ